MDDPQVDLLADVDLEQRVLERLDRTGDVTLEDEVERLDLALLEDLLRSSRLTRLRVLASWALRSAACTLLGDLTGGAVVVGDEERVAGAGAPR